MQNDEAIYEFKCVRCDRTDYVSKEVPFHDDLLCLPCLMPRHFKWVDGKVQPQGEEKC